MIQKVYGLGECGHPVEMSLEQFKELLEVCEKDDEERIMFVQTKKNIKIELDMVVEDG